MSSYDSPRRRLRSSSSSPMRARTLQPPPQFHQPLLAFGSPPANVNFSTPFQSPFGSPTSPMPVPLQAPNTMPTPDARFFGKAGFTVKTKGKHKNSRVPDPPFKRSPIPPSHKESLQAFNEEIQRCFEFLGQIGAGSFGIVNLVRSKVFMPADPASNSGEVVQGALFALKRSRHPSAQTLEEWRNAVALQQHGCHPNLIRYIRVFVPRTDNAHGESHHPMAVDFLMEYVGDHSQAVPRDPSLATKLSNEASVIPEPSVWPMIRDLLYSLHHIHSNGFIHMDVKPENIMFQMRLVSVTGQTNTSLKLGDFGTMREIDKAGEFDEGDKKYVAHELLNWNKTPSPKADMFSLGIVILELATNIEVPSGDDPYDQLRVPNLTDVPNFNSLSKKLQRLILSLLHSDPTKRPSAESLLTGEEYPDLRSADDRPSRHTRRHSNPSRPSSINSAAAGANPALSPGSVHKITPLKSKSQPFLEPQLPQTMPPVYRQTGSAALANRKVTGMSTTRLDRRKSGRGRRSSDNEDEDDAMEVDSFQPRALSFEPAK